MREFKDTAGRVWKVAITGATLKRTADLLGVDLGDPLGGDPPLLTRLATDIAFLVDLVYVVCKPEADSSGVSDADFAGLLDGDALQAAHDALLEEYRDFFRSLRRGHLARTLDGQREIIAKATATAEQQIGEALTRLGDSVANLPPLPDAIPSPAPSAS